MKMHQRNGIATKKPKLPQQQPHTYHNHYLKYQLPIAEEGENGKAIERNPTGKDGVVRILPPVSAAETHAVEKERKDRTILLMVIPKEHLRRFHGMDDATRKFGKPLSTRFGGNAKYKEISINLRTVKGTSFSDSLPQLWIKGLCNDNEEPNQI
ncbi:hypothetical protein Tco_0079601 [Tanacetum coccineum]